MIHQIWNHPLGRIGILAFFVGTVTTLVFNSRPRQAEKAERAQLVQAEVQRNREEAVAEYEHRKTLANAAAAESSEMTLSVEEPENPVPSTDDWIPDTIGAPMPDDEHEPRVTSGPYKGMTREEAKAAEKKRRDWYIREIAYRKRHHAYLDKFLSHSASLRASSQEKISLMLAVLSLLSPEQLDYVCQEVLKTHPAAEVDEFLNAIDLDANTKTPERIARDVQKLLKSREIYKFVERELAIEKEVLRREKEDLERTRPSH